MSKAEIDAERINWLVKTFGEVSIGTQIDFLRWMDDREAVLVAALEHYADEKNWVCSGDNQFDEADWWVSDQHAEGSGIAREALAKYRGERSANAVQKEIDDEK